METPFGELLRRHRKSAGLTQEALAEVAGISVRAVSDLERGARHAPRQVTVQLLCEALQLSGAERVRIEEAARRLHGSASRGPQPLSIVTAGSHLSVLHQLTQVFGREPELHALGRHLEFEGPPVLVLAGEPGIGKSRLLIEVADRARTMGLHVLQGGCQRRSVQMPYAPLSDMLSRCVETLVAAGHLHILEDCTWLSRLMPELGSSLGEPIRLSSMAPQEERRLVFEAVVRLLSRLSESGGLLLVLDDLQWAPTDSLDLLTVLVHDPALHRVRVVAAYRDTDSSPDDPLATALADLAHSGLVKQLSIGPLGDAAAHALLTSLVPDERYSGQFQDHVVQITGRVPFFVMRYAQDMQQRDSNIALGPDIPWDIAHSVRQRVNALPPLAREIVRTASVVGRTAPWGLLATVIGRPELEVLEALEKACAARLLVEAGERSYQFAHDVIREVVEDDLGFARRAALHRRIAEALETIPDSRPEDLAHHYARSDQPERALTYLLRAADRSHAAAAPREEAALLEQAIELASATGSGETINNLRVRRARSLMTAALWKDAREEYLLVLPQLPLDTRVPALVDLAVLSHWLLDVPATHRYANEALERATEMGRDDLAAAAEVALALASSSDGDLDASVHRYRRAYERNNRKHILLPSAGVELQGLVLYWRGDIDAAIALSRDTIEMGRASYDTTSVVRSLGNLGMSLVGKGQYAEAEQVFLEARAFARDRNLVTWLARATAMHAGLHLQLFDFDAAEALSEEARDTSSSANWTHATISGGIDLLLNYTRSGDFGRARGLVAEVAEGVAGSQGAHGWLWRLRFAQAQAELALLAEDWGEALRWAEAAGERSRRHGRIKYEVLASVARGHALAGAGRTPEAIQEFTSAVDRARKSGDPMLRLQAASDLLAIDGGDELLRDARNTLTLIVEAVPPNKMRRKVQASTSAGIVASLTASA